MTDAAATRMRCFSCLLISATVLSPHASWSGPISDSTQTVVVLSVDGLAGFYWDDPKAEMPTIRALADAGASATAMTTVAPTVTWPNHTTLVTGATPARHGVVGNDYYDRLNNRLVALMSDPAGCKVPLVKAPTIYDAAKARGLGTAAIRWPATRGAKTLDWTLPDVFSDELLHEYTTPALVAECREAGIWSDGEAVQSGGRELRIVSDKVCTRVFNFILRTHRPGLALLHLTNVDHVEHQKGPRTAEAYAAIKSADAQVREVWQEIKRAFPRQTTLLIVSDHGFSPVDRVVLPNIVLRAAGLVETNNGKATGGSVRVVTQGGAALLYVLDDAQRAAIIEQVRKSCASLEGIGKIVGPGELSEHGFAEPKDDLRAPDMILFAKEGYAFGETATGAESIIQLAERKGAHGHDENLSAMDAIFVAWGRGIKPARLGKISNLDVAPTIAKLLDLELPGSEGKPLVEALDE